MLQAGAGHLLQAGPVVFGCRPQRAARSSHVLKPHASQPQRAAAMPLGCRLQRAPALALPHPACTHGLLCSPLHAHAHNDMLPTSSLDSPQRLVQAVNLSEPGRAPQRMWDGELDPEPEPRQAPSGGKRRQEVSHR